ncbi:uncharacterized protein LOC143208037 [Lasioglossum baleicum]|uniref:uncharacterized protein LOC143208037 n=1 Tax=Lasioglossum baleicum TaxID=434251 RepID=UPI003FCC67B3
MDDINAKRNARRKRILENSEKRLLKITGSSGDTKSEDTSSQTSSICREIQDEKPQQSINGTISEKYYDGIKDTNISEPYNVCNNMFIPPKDKYNNTRTETEEVDSTFTPTRISRPLLPMNRLNYILIALIVNILLALELDYLFGKTVVAPYLPVMLVRLYNCISTQATHDGSLLYTALILCNVKPKVTRRLKTFATVFYMVIEDLALYVFSFTAIYYTFFHCLYKTDTETVLNV